MQHWKKFPAISLLLLLAVAAWQDSLEPRVGVLEGQMHSMETRVVYLESWHPTVEFWTPTYTPFPTFTPTATYTPLPTFTPTATPEFCWGYGRVNTPGSALRVRDAPNGAQIGRLAHNTSITYRTDTRQAGGLTWVELDSGGWVALEYVVQDGRLECPHP